MPDAPCPKPHAHAQVSALVSAEAPRLRPGPCHLLLYAPEEDAVCLLRSG